MTFIAEYAWSQAEPAAAIFAACIVTYRPLFADLGMNLSKVSSLFSGSGRSNGRGDGLGSNTIEEPPYQQSKRQDSYYRLQKLNVKAAEKGLHVVEMTLPASDSENQTFYQHPRTRLSIRESMR